MNVDVSLAQPVETNDRCNVTNRLGECAHSHRKKAVLFIFIVLVFLAPSEPSVKVY